jgi:hypothetical protein
MQTLRDKQPTCPKFLQIKCADMPRRIDKQGVFQVASNHLLDWVREKRQPGRYRDLLVGWIENREDSNLQPYRLSKDTVFEMKLEFFIDDILMKGEVGTVYCPQCNEYYATAQISYENSLSGGWVTNLATCPNEHVLFAVEVMHFMFREDTKRPPRRVLREAVY